MPAVMRASAAAERAGFPAVAIAGSGFEPMGRAIGKSLGVPHVPIVGYPGVILTDDNPTFQTKMREIVAPAVLDAFAATQGSEAPAGPAPDPGPRDVVFRGSLDEVQDHFDERGWSDGLPIIPPTRECVDRFLAHTARDPDEVLGHMEPDLREATVWNVAVNGVMAGCRPEYMPVLLGIAECLADPEFRTADAGSTPGWEPLVVLSGPVVKALDFNFGTGAMRVGRRANTSVGRFTRMYLNNIAGLHIPPVGDTDQGAIAQSFNVVLAENDAAVQRLGWPSFSQDRGFEPGESSVTVQSCVSISAPIYSGGETPDDHLRTIATLFQNAIGPWAFGGFEYGAWTPLLVLGPAIAATFARHGIDKAAVRTYLGEHMTIRVREVEECAWMTGPTSFSIASLVEQGRLDERYAGTDRDRLIPSCANADDIGIVLAGNESRNQSKAYVQNHYQGVPVSRRLDI